VLADQLNLMWIRIGKKWTQIQIRIQVMNISLRFIITFISSFSFFNWWTFRNEKAFFKQFRFRFRKPKTFCFKIFVYILFLGFGSAYNSQTWLKYINWYGPLPLNSNRQTKSAQFNFFFRYSLSRSIGTGLFID